MHDSNAIKADKAETLRNDILSLLAREPDKDIRLAALYMALCDGVVLLFQGNLEGRERFAREAASDLPSAVERRASTLSPSVQ